MPNLLPSIETSDLYHEDLTTSYNFVDCAIENTAFKLRRAAGDFNGVFSHIYLLEDNNGQHLAIMRLIEKQINGKIYHQICKSYSLVQNKGFGEILYEGCLKIHDNDIISDSLNTLPGSYNLWKKIINKKNITVYKLNVDNNKSYKLKTPINDFSIWGIEPAFLDTIKNTPWEAVVFQDNSGEIDDEIDDYFVDYLTENDTTERTILSDFIVRALQNKVKFKDRRNTLLLVKKST